MRAVVAALAVAAMWPGAADALSPCPGGPPKARTLVSWPTGLESVIVDAKGRLFFTDGSGGRLMRLDRPGAQPRVLVSDIDGAGGLALDPDGSILMGRGNNTENGLVGGETGPAGILKVNPDTGASSVYATNMAMANGAARGPDGALYGTDDLGSSVDRVPPGGGVAERGFAQVESGNGDAVDPTGRYLYVNQTFQPAAIQQVDLEHPDQVTPYFTATDPADLPAGLDGMAIDPAGRLYSAANGTGQIWRVDPGMPAQGCLLFGGLDRYPNGPSATAVGTTGSFPPANLYVVTFGGDLIELRDAVQVDKP
jgi:gluconolactonase